MRRGVNNCAVTGALIASERPRGVPQLANDERGSLFLEYLILFGILGVLLLIMVGPKMSELVVFQYRARAAILYSTTP